MAEVEAHGSTCEGVDAAMVEARAQAAFEHAERVRERLVLAVNGAELVVQSPAWGLGDTVRGMLSIRRFTLSFVPSADAVEGLGRAAEWLSQVLPQRFPLNAVERIVHAKPWRGGQSVQIVTKEKRVFEFAFGSGTESAAVADRVVQSLAECAFCGPDAVQAFAPHMVTPWSCDLAAEYTRLGIGPTNTATSTTTDHVVDEVPEEGDDEKRCPGPAPGPVHAPPTAEAWRVSLVNDAFSLCPSYPRVLVVPTTVDDGVVADAAAFRTKARGCALTWLHPETGAAVVRAAQPLTGLVGRRSDADEAMLNAISAASPGPGPLHILDARPRSNALGNTVKGAGFERVANYEAVDLTYLDIGNIHVMRSSLEKLRALVAEPSSDDPAAQSKWLSGLESTKWLDHLRIILAGALTIVEYVEFRSESVLVHCSDSWDRTTQLVTLAQLMMDPYYRTLDGFAVLMEKDWVSFGHRFARRAGQGAGDYEDDQRAPIFVQWMDTVFQLMVQAPRAFEFNERFLIALIDARLSGAYGTFLFDNQAQRVMHRVDEVTTSVWAHHLSSPLRETYLNPMYTPDPGTIRIVASLTRIRLWDTYYLRYHPHMKFSAASAQAARSTAAAAAAIASTSTTIADSSTSTSTSTSTPTSTSTSTS